MDPVPASVSRWIELRVVGAVLRESPSLPRLSGRCRPKLNRPHKIVLAQRASRAYHSEIALAQTFEDLGIRARDDDAEQGTAAAEAVTPICAEDRLIVPATGAATVALTGEMGGAWAGLSPARIGRAFDRVAVVDEHIRNTISFDGRPDRRLVQRGERLVTRTVAVKHVLVAAATETALLRVVGSDRPRPRAAELQRPGGLEAV